MPLGRGREKGVDIVEEEVEGREETLEWCDALKCKLGSLNLSCPKNVCASGRGSLNREFKVPPSVRATKGRREEEESRDL